MMDLIERAREEEKLLNDYYRVPKASAVMSELITELEAAREDAIKWRKYGHLFKKMSDVAETMAPVIQFRIELQEAAKKAKEINNE